MTVIIIIIIIIRIHAIEWWGVTEQLPNLKWCAILTAHSIAYR